MTRVRTRLTSLALTVAVATLVLPLVPAPAVAEPIVPVPSNIGCDPIDPAACLLPFPNDFFTVEDESTDTGRRVNFNPLAMPRNGTEVTEGGEGKPIDPTEWNRNDGFSPGSMVMTFVEGIDLHATWGTQDRAHSEVGVNELGYFDHRDHIADIDLYQAPDAPMVIVNAETGERHPFWSEVDTHPGAAGEQTLILRPARNFDEGARYVVALRNLKRTDGTVIETGSEFAAYRSGEGSDADRQAHFEENVFPILEGAGVARDDLYLAWDFTVASERNLAERMLHMRDDAFGRILGDVNLADQKVEGSAPEFTIESVGQRTDTWTDSRGVARSQQVRRVEGRVTVPNYLDRIQQTEGHAGSSNAPADAPAPGSRLLDLDLDGLPDQNPVESTVNVPFICDTPLNGEANYPMLYGHGLLGSRDQIGDLKSPRRNGPFMGCAVDWWGMSTVDLPTVAAIIADMSGFPSLPDRAQQGFLNFMFLGRALVHPEGLASDEAFQDGGESLIKTASEDKTWLYYDGNSQGGIMGGSLVAVSPDISRGILGVPGMNYSTLLQRSVDWEDLYAIPYYEVYRDPIERQVVFSLIQMLWDRGEANGYAEHMTTDPYENTPPHEVMLQVAFSDHQVTNHAAEVEARTIGAPIMTPGLPEGRHWEMNPYQAGTAEYPYQGSSLIYWDSGNATPPNGNIPADQNGDPHSHPRSEPAAGWQEAQFLLTGWNVDVCGGGFYLTDNHPANNGVPSCQEPLYAAGLTPTEVVFTPATASSGQFSDATIFEARVTNAFTGNALAAAPVEFTLSGAGAARTFTATTNSDGVARVTPSLIEAPGSYELTVSYEGTDELVGDTDSRPFTVAKEDTKTSLAVAGTGSKRTLTATLADLDSSLGVAGRTISFYSAGKLLGSAVTGADGTARMVAPPAYRGGKHTFEARFGGDAYYLASSGTASS